MYNFSVRPCKSALADQIGAARQLFISNLELEDGWDSCPLDAMDGEQMEEARDLLIDAGQKIALLRCSLPMEERERLERFFQKAHLLNAEAVRMECRKYTDFSRLLSDFQQAVRIGQAYGIQVYFENSADSLLNTRESIEWFFQRIEGPSGWIFNPLEMVKTGRHPFFHVFYSTHLKNQIAVLRINDGLYQSKNACLPGHGNGEIKELASILLARSFRGYFSFSLPSSGGFSMEESVALFKGMLKEM